MNLFSFAASVETFRASLVMAIAGAVIATVLFAVKPLIKNRLPKTAQYYLWLVALAAFLVPASAFIAIPAGAQMPSISSAVDWYVVTAEEVDQRIEPYERTDGGGYVGVPEEYQETVEALVPEPWVTEIVDWAKFLWYIGALVSLSVFVWSYYTYVEYVAKKHNRAALPEQIALLAELTERPPRLFLNAKAATPMLIGLFCPAIVLPDREYSDGQLRAVMLHELTHLRRKDVLIKWLSVLACSLHWFNPLAWLARRKIDRACELACDEAVVRTLDADGRQSYGDTLIAVAADSKMPRAVLSTTMCERKKSLKERLDAIMEHKKTTKAAVAISIALVTLLAGCAAILGAGRGESNEKVHFRPGERREIARLNALTSSDYADITVKFAETSGPAGFSLFVEQNGGEIEQENIAIGESATFTVSGYSDTVIYAVADENSAGGNVIFETSQTSALLAPPGIIPDGIDVPGAVLEAAIDWVKGDFEGYRDIGVAAQKELGVAFDDWRLEYLEHAYRYNGMSIEIYRFEWRVHTTTPDKIALAGGMELSEDGWLLDTYPDSWYLLFNDMDGELVFFTAMMANDCAPGDEAFTADMLNRLDELSGQRDAPGKIEFPEKPPEADVRLVPARSPEQRVTSEQLTRSWSSVDADGNGTGYVVDVVHPLVLEDYETVTLRLNNEGGEINLEFGDYPPQTVRVRRWDAKHVGTESLDVYAGGEAVSVDGNTFTVGDDGNDYIYEIYATWPEGDSSYAFRVDNVGKRSLASGD